MTKNKKISAEYNELYQFVGSCIQKGASSLTKDQLAEVFLSLGRMKILEHTKFKNAPDNIKFAERGYFTAVCKLASFLRADVPDELKNAQHAKNIIANELTYAKQHYLAAQKAVPGYSALIHINVCNQFYKECVEKIDQAVLQHAKPATRAASVEKQKKPPIIGRNSVLAVRPQSVHVVGRDAKMDALVAVAFGKK